MLHKETDAFNSLHQFLVAQDDFGGANGPAHPAGAGLAALNVQSNAARATRAQKTYGLILTHVEHEDIKDAIQDHVINTLPAVPGGAAAIAAALAAGAPAPVAVLPPDWVSLLWAWIDVTYGQPQQTGLLHLNLGNKWTGIKITDVGINRDTIALEFAKVDSRSTEVFEWSLWAELRALDDGETPGHFFPFVLLVECESPPVPQNPLEDEEVADGPIPA